MSTNRTEIKMTTVSEWYEQILENLTRADKLAREILPPKPLDTVEIEAESFSGHLPILESRLRTVARLTKDLADTLSLIVARF